MSSCLASSSSSFKREMSFSDSSLLKKLQELNSTQQSVQTLSLWLIHHRKYAKTVVNTWLRQLEHASKSERKLTFLYLANDILQNSRKKGDEYMNEFSTVIEKVKPHVFIKFQSKKISFLRYIKIHLSNDNSSISFIISIISSLFFSIK